MSDRRWGCYYVRCPFCGRAAPLVEGFEGQRRIDEPLNRKQSHTAHLSASGDTYR